MSDEPPEEVRRYVQANREELIEAVKHGDQFVRKLAIAALARGGEANLEVAKRELEEALDERR